MRWREEIRASFSNQDDKVSGPTVSFRLAGSPHLQYHFRQDDNTKNIMLMPSFIISYLFAAPV